MIPLRYDALCSNLGEDGSPNTGPLKLPINDLQVSEQSTNADFTGE